MIKASHISKSYRRGSKDVSALLDVSFDLGVGETVSLLGKSGSGKTTLLNLLAGLDRTTSGDLEVDGTNLTHCSPRDVDQFRRQSIGIVFQQFRLLRHQTALQNVGLPLMISGVGSAKRTERAKQCLDLVGLSDRMSHKPAEMSGGEQQRVAIARAIANQPKVLLADEPTGNLDSANAVSIMDLLMRVKIESGSTIILITHDEELASQYTDRIIRLADGRLVSDSQKVEQRHGSAANSSSPCDEERT